MRRSRKILLVAAVLLLILVLPLLWLLHTESGLRFAVARAQGAVAGLRIDQASGTLAGTVRLRRVAYEGDGVHIDVAGLGATPRWAPLIAGRIALAAVEADGVHVRFAAAPPRLSP